MSAVIQLARIRGFRKGLSLLTPKEIVRSVTCRNVSTSTKKNDTKSVENTSEPEPYMTKRSWVSYGFNYDDKFSDRHDMHQTMFITVTICLVFGAFVVGYMPDPRLKDWSKREAYLQLRYREENGLPLIDPNIVDPSKFTLPTDEELGDTEIII